MIFEYKKGYSLYTSLSKIVDSIKTWLRSYFYYKSFLNVFRIYLTYSNFKKILKSDKIHENFI